MKIQLFPLTFDKNTFIIIWKGGKKMTKKRLTVFILTLCMMAGLFVNVAYATDPGNIPATDPTETTSPTGAPEINPDPSDTTVSKVQITMAYAKPVVFGKVESCAVKTSTTGCSITKVEWYDPNGNIVAGDTFEKNGKYKLEVTVSALNGYTFSNSTAVYLNNSRAACSIGAEVLKMTATLESVYWAPVINVQPDTRKQVLTEGDSLKLTASASYYDKVTWKIISPDKKTYTVEKAAEKHPGLTVIGADKPTLQLNNIPLSMSGWRLYCTFSNDASHTDTQGIPLVVNKDPNKKPEPTPTPTPETTPEPTPEADPNPEQEPAEDPGHVHSFLDSWAYDGQAHWHECACGAIAESQSHNFVWTTVKAATKNAPGEEQGVCATCGFTTSRQIEAKQKEHGKAIILIPVVIVVAVVILIGYMLNTRSKAAYAASKHGKHSKH